MSLPFYYYYYLKDVVTIHEIAWVERNSRCHGAKNHGGSSIAPCKNAVGNIVASRGRASQIYNDQTQ
jgi:hypothetical protein